MLQELKLFLDKYGIDTRTKIAVAVSGGLDSMVLLHLLSRLSKNLIVLHVNYQLRDEDSHLDELFVKDYCAQNNIEFFSLLAKINDKDISIQSEARRIRYDWFDNRMKDLNISFLFLAHHLDDQLETFLMNIERGSGINGLSGIKEKNNNYLRPLLNYRKEELLDFSLANNVLYRTDKSNLENKYLRNRLRNTVIPGLKEALPNLMKGFSKSISLLAKENQGRKELFERLNQLIEKQGFISYDEIGDIQSVQLEGYFSSLGIRDKEYEKLATCVENRKWGRVFIADDYKITIERSCFAFKKQEDSYFRFEVDANTKRVLIEDKELHLTKVKIEEVDFSLSGEYLNLEKMAFPLIVRSWEKGDRFIPLGMKGVKKLSDFFIDLKLSSSEKKKAIVIETNGEIVAVLPYRIDNRYKIDKASNSAYLVNLKTL